MSADLGAEDFTIEFIGKPLSVTAPKDHWINVAVVRDSKTTHHHTTEDVNGVLFVSHRVYDGAGELAEVHLTRADLVRGQANPAPSADT